MSLSATSSTWIAPPVGSARRARSLIKVVLPAPFSPTMARLFPAGMTRFDRLQDVALLPRVGVPDAIEPNLPLGRPVAGTKPRGSARPARASSRAIVASSVATPRATRLSLTWIVAQAKAASTAWRTTSELAGSDASREGVVDGQGDDAGCNEQDGADSQDGVADRAAPPPPHPGHGLLPLGLEAVPQPACQAEDTHFLLGPGEEEEISQIIRTAQDAGLLELSAGDVNLGDAHAPDAVDQYERQDQTGPPLEQRDEQDATDASQPEHPPVDEADYGHPWSDGARVLGALDQIPKGWVLQVSHADGCEVRLEDALEHPGAHPQRYLVTNRCGQ